MNDRKRNLILQVIDGDVRVIQSKATYHLDRFVHSERMFEYLVKEKITGAKFHEMYLNVFKGSWLTMGKWIISKIQKEKELKPVFVGKDYRA